MLFKMNRISSLLCRRFATATASNIKVTRDPRFSHVTDRDVDFFKSVCGETAVITDPHELKTYNEDWTHQYVGNTRLAVRPASTEQVSEVLKYCNTTKLAVVPQGGNTGLVGGSVPVFDEIVLSMGRMDKILDFDQVSGTITCQAGCILEKLDSYCDERGYMMPIDLGAKGSCQIGGNLATNAGGLRLIRYGSLHGNTLGLEAVLADGTVLNTMSTLRKDNTGYDLKQLFIGSEGTLGVITACNILLPRKPRSVKVAFLALDSFEAVRATLATAKEELCEILSAYEFLDAGSLQSVLTQLSGTRHPLPDTNTKFYVLIEVAGSSAEHDEAKLQAFLERVLNNGHVVDGAISQDHQQLQNIWKCREGISESMTKAGAVYKYDVTLPLSHFYAIVENVRARVKDCNANVVGYGHIGDGNLHLNVGVPRQDKEEQRKVLDRIEPYVYQQVQAARGSISAEHGLGLQKADKILYSKSPEAVRLMQRFRNIMDPNGILNPYKYIHLPDWK